MYGLDSLTISASGLTAQRLRMDVIANNIANAQTTRTPEGGPYRRETVVLTAPGSGLDFQTWLTAALQDPGLQWDDPSAAGPLSGVQVAGIVPDPSPFKVVYDPSNPDAVNGYVQMPNVDISTEMVDLVAAERVYEANVTAFDAAKQMDITALNLAK